MLINEHCDCDCGRMANANLAIKILANWPHSMHAVWRTASLLFTKTSRMTRGWRLTDFRRTFRLMSSQTVYRLSVVSRPSSMWRCYDPARREGDIKRCFRLSIRLSTRPSVAYIANNWGTRRPSVPKFGAKVPRRWCDLHASFKVKRSKVKVTRPIDGDVVRHIFQMARPTNFKIGIRMEEDDPHLPQAPWPPRSKLTVAWSRDQSEPSWPNAVLVSLEAKVQQYYAPSNSLRFG